MISTRDTATLTRRTSSIVGRIASMLQQQLAVPSHTPYHAPGLPPRQRVRHFPSFLHQEHNFTFCHRQYDAH